MFTDMRHGTAEEWAHIAAEHYKHQASTAPRQILENLRRLEAIDVDPGIETLIARIICPSGFAHRLSFAV